jgi:hypothetical protein
MTFGIYFLKLRHTLRETKASTSDYLNLNVFESSIHFSKYFIRYLPESESVSIVTSRWRFPFRSVHFRSSVSAHCLSLTGFHSLVNFSNSFWYRNFYFLDNIWYLSALASSRTSPGTLPFPQFPQGAHNHFIDVTELYLFCILFFFIATDPSKNVIYFYLKFWIQG